MRAKYLDLLRDEDVKRWYENLAAKSILTATVYLRGLGLYCALNNTSPKEILQTAQRKEFRDGFADFVRRLEREGKAGSYIARFKKVILSWLAFNNISVKLKVNIARESDAPTIADERVPTKEELAKILRKASSRGRVAIALMAFSGLRPESLGDYLGTDGLRLGDFKEAKIEPKAVEFERVPTMLVIRANLSKARHQYFTFVPQEALTYIKEYLEERAKAGEVFNKDTPLFHFDPRGPRKNAFLRTTLITRDIKEAIKAAGFSWRPYVLRSYFATAMDIAESRGLISHPWRQFLMGHKGDIEARYSTNKGRLPPEMIEEMRSSYSKCEPLLSTLSPSIEQSSVVKEAKIEALKSIAKSMFGIDLLEVKVAKEKELKRELTYDEQIELFESEIRRLREPKADPQIIVKEDVLEKYLKDGWQFVSVLPSQRILIRKQLN